MMRAVFTFAALVSVIFFPWPFTVILALAVSYAEPLVPLAVGIFADTLYYAPPAGAFPFPFFTLCGAVVTIIAFLVRSRLRASPVR